MPKAKSSSSFPKVTWRVCENFQHRASDSDDVTLLMSLLSFAKIKNPKEQKIFSSIFHTLLELPINLRWLLFNSK